MGAASDFRLTAMPQTLQELFAAAAFAELPSRGLLRIAGPDATRWLNGMVTASAQSLADGSGAYTFLLNSQGRILGDGTLYREGDAFLLSTEASQAEGLQTHLERYIIMDDVELSLLPAAAALLVAGPAAVERLIELDITAPTTATGPDSGIASGIATGPATGIAQQDFVGSPLSLMTQHTQLLPRIEITGPAEAIAALAGTLRAAGVPAMTPQDLLALRLMEGTPLYGTDITERDLPQETAQDRALHFSKGCYLGQEIVERIHSRGQVHRLLQLFELSVPVPAEQLPIALTMPGDPAKSVGSLTSTVSFEFGSRQINLGLGIVRREASVNGSSLRYAGGEASPVTIPFDPTRSTTAAD